MRRHEDPLHPVNNPEYTNFRRLGRLMAVTAAIAPPILFGWGGVVLAVLLLGGAAWIRRMYELELEHVRGGLSAHTFDEAVRIRRLETAAAIDSRRLVRLEATTKPRVVRDERRYVIDEAAAKITHHWRQDGIVIWTFPRALSEEERGVIRVTVMSCGSGEGPLIDKLRSAESPFVVWRTANGIMHAYPIRLLTDQRLKPLGGACAIWSVDSSLDAWRWFLKVKPKSTPKFDLTPFAE